MVIWITGISGSGKTTIAKTLISLLKKKIPEMINVDGDEIRQIFEEKLGYSEFDRKKQIQRIQRLCLLLDAQKQLVIASALYSNEELLKWNRQNFSDYYEIYLNASLKLVEKRDVKGLYKKARQGLEKNIVGLDIPWNVPKKPDLKVDCNKNYSIEETIQKIIYSIPRFKTEYENLS